MSTRAKKKPAMAKKKSTAARSKAKPAETAPSVTEAVTEADIRPVVPSGEHSERTIRAAAIELLTHVAYHEDKTVKSSDENRVAAEHPQARTVGIPYDEIIRRIQEEFPDCQTSPACLRWYSVKIRVEEHGYENLRLPQRRPRAKSQT